MCAYDNKHISITYLLKVLYLFHQHASNRIGGVMFNVFASWSHHLTKNGGLGPATFHWSAYNKWAVMYIGVSILPLSTIFRWNFFIVPKGGICFYQFHPLYPCLLRGRRGRDRMVVGFTTTRPISNVGVRTPFIAKCNRYNIMWYSLSVTCGRSVDFCLYSTNKTDSNDITDILLKMALNTINQTKQNLACHNIIDITKISQLYYYLGYTIRYIMLKVSVHLIHNA
jgi:hypothetical protein